MSLLPASSIGDESTGFYNGVATQSLRMNFGDSSYLYYTPSTGDRFTGTYSTWYKGSLLSDSSYGAYYFNAYGGGSEVNFTFAHIANDFQLAFDAYGRNYFHSNALYRDETNWYNIVWVWDTPNGTTAKRQRGFVNGEEVTSMSIDSRSSHRQMLAFGGNHQHTIFANYYNGNYDSYASGHHSYNVYVNGHALDPTAFGELKNGVWIPKNYATKPSLIAQDTGTAIGDMTEVDGLAGAFDGNRFESYSNAAVAYNVGTTAGAYIGKNWGSSKKVTGFILYSPTQYGFVGSNGSSFTVRLYGSNSNPSNSTDGTLLYTSSSVNDNLISTNGERGSLRYFADTTMISEETVSNFTTDTSYSYHWVVLTPNTTESIHVGEIEFYEDGNNYFGTGGFRLDFNASDLNTTGGSRTDPYGSDTDQPNNSIADASGSGNHLSYSGVVATDFSKDSPENNFCVLNALGKQSSGAVSEGNLKAVITSGGNSGRIPGTFAVNSGKWYWEVRQSSSNRFGMGVFDTDRYVMTNEDLGSDAYEWGFITSDNSGSGARRNSNTIVNGYGGETADGHVVMVALDVDNEAIYFGKQGSWFNNGTSDNSATVKGQIEAGTTTNAAYTGVSGRLTPSFVRQTSNNTLHVNFGQDDTFAGNETTAGNTDGNGNGKFQYEPPSGFLALCSDNLPNSTIGPQTSTQADDHFDTITYSGSASNQTVTTNFQADWLWFKERTTSGIDFNLFDSSRLHSSSSAKFGRKLESNTADAETDSTAIVSQSTNDITLLGGVSTTNDTFSRTYVMWHWKANGGTTTTNDASSTSVGTIDSVYQANTDAGFSIVTYTGTGSNGTIAHGLGAVPKMMIAKRRDSSSHWVVYHQDLTDASYWLALNLTNAQDVEATHWNSTAPTSTLINLGSNTNTNGSTATYVIYAFTDVEGYSKFGKYVGNGSTDGTFVYTGFRPAWVMVKNINSNSASWHIYDNKRDTFNRVDSRVNSNSTSKEDEIVPFGDFLSNGFKLRPSSSYLSQVNSNNSTYVYMAFAEQPFKFSNAR